MTNQEIDYEYYEWLVSQIRVPTNKSLRDVFERMHNLEFVWFIPNDDNRVQDALDLRVQFLNGDMGRREIGLSLQGATILEVLVSLSRRIAFTAGGNSETWAWKLLKNLRLNKFVDPLLSTDADRVDDILQSVVWRTYEPDGYGGFFPLKNPTEDQTKVEIWYQMNAYAIELRDEQPVR